MKRYIFIAAAFAITLASCSKIYDATPVNNEPAIGFGSWAETLTKTEARVQGTNTFLAGDTFAVYGYKDKSTPAPVTVFDDIVVTASGNPVDSWDYSNHRYWDTAYDSYTFFAISPSAIGTEADGTNSSTNVNPQTGAFVTRSITFSGDDNDILVADKKVVAKGETPFFSNYATVPIVFNHVASLVDFKVKKAPSLSTTAVKVSAFSLSNIDNEGQLTVTAAYTENHPVASWTNPGTARTTYGPGDGVNDDVDISSPITIAEDTAFNTASPTDPANSTPLIKSLVVMPQAFRNSGGTNPQTLTISYQLGTDPTTYTRTLYLADFDADNDNAEGPSDQIGSWEPGKHYTFYITIEAHAISFSATITPWTTVNGYHYLTN